MCDYYSLMKLCSKCKSEKSESEFGVDNNRPDRLYPWCKSCCTEARRRRKASMTEEELENNRAYHRLHGKMWREKNPDRARVLRESPKAKARVAEWRERKLAEDPDYFRSRARVRAKAYYHRKPDWKKWAHHLRRYGITPEAYRDLFESQGNACGACGTKDPTPWIKGKTPWHVDHCHTTNIVRGILCERCNTVLGRVREDESVAIGIADYIRRKCNTIKAT